MNARSGRLNYIAHSAGEYLLVADLKIYRINSSLLKKFYRPVSRNIQASAPKLRYMFSPKDRVEQSFPELELFVYKQVAQTFPHQAAKKKTGDERRKIRYLRGQGHPNATAESTCGAGQA